jgi:hypothetical protein
MKTLKTLIYKNLYRSFQRAGGVLLNMLIPLAKSCVLRVLNVPHFGSISAVIEIVTFFTHENRLLVHFVLCVLRSI